MFYKLLKYDMQTGARKYFMMAIIMVVLSVVTISTVFIENAVINSIVLITAVFGTLACVGIVVFVSISHIYTQICGRESYLTHTLPVGTKLIVISKIVAITIWTTLCAVVLCLYWFMYYCIHASETTKEVIDIIIKAFKEPGDLGFNIGVFLLISLITSLILNIVLLPLSAGIANLPAIKNRNAGIILGVISWYGLGQVIGFIVVAFWIVILLIGGGSMSNDYLEDSANIKFVLESLQYTMLVGYLAASAVVYFFASYIIEKHRSI